MKTSSLWTTVGLLALCATYAPAEETQPTALAIGSAAPMSTTKMKGVDGNLVAIADLAGTKGTLVVFTCNSCPWAKAWETRLVALGNGCAKQGIGMVAINSNDPAKNAEDGYDVMRQRARQRSMKFAYVVDGTSDVARAFGATRTPEVFLFDASGKLVYHGAIDDNAKQPDQVTERYLDGALKAVAAGKDVAVQETKALGCSIKFRSKA